MAKKKKYITIIDGEKTTIVNVQIYDQFTLRNKQIHFYKINKQGNVLNQVFSWDFETTAQAKQVFDAIITKIEQ